MRSITPAWLKVKAAIKAGGMKTNHARAGLKVKAGIKAGSIMRRNHQPELCVACSPSPESGG